MNEWEKVGLIFELPRGLGWAASHAALPFAEILGKDRARVSFCARDAANRAQIGSFETTLSKRSAATAVSSAPVIGLGPLGAFDDSGVTSSWITEHGGRKFQYYTGWTRGVSVPFYFYVGLAISEDGGRTYRKHSPAPILERDDVDPFLTASPCVLVENGVWRMWYVSCTGWKIVDGAPRHDYHVKYAESSDGIRWKRTGHVCIDYSSSDEYAFARPCVLREGGLYRMWYSHRGSAYRIGYAESSDGLKWERKDELVGIGTSKSGWDSEMLAYAHVFRDGERLYMLYNGNAYGKTGIGLAVARSRPS